MSWVTTIELIGMSAANINEDDQDAILSGIAKCSDDLEVYNLEIILMTDSSLQRRRSFLEHTIPGTRIDYVTTLILEVTSYSNASTLVCVHFGGCCSRTKCMRSPMHTHLRTPTHAFAHSCGYLHYPLLTATSVLFSNIRFD